MDKKIALLAALALIACGDDDATDMGPDAKAPGCISTFDDMSRRVDCEVYEVLGATELNQWNELTGVYAQCLESYEGRADCEAERGDLVACWESIENDTCDMCVAEKDALLECTRR